MRKIALPFAVVIYIMATSSYSQVDKWNKIVDNSQEAYETRLAYNDSVMAYYRKKDTDSAIFYCQKHIRIAQEGNVSASINYGFSVIGSLYRYKGDYDSSIYYHQIALQGYKNDNYTEAIAGSYTNIANVYKQKSRYDLAIRYYFEAIRIMKMAEDQSTLASIYANLAGLYFNLENYEKAYHFWDLSEQVCLKTRYKGNVTFSYRGKARIGIVKQNYPEAERNIKAAIQVDKENGNQLWLFENYLLLLQLYSKNGNTPQFLDTYKEVKKFKDIESPINKVHFYEFTGDFWFRFKNYSKAATYYDSCLSVVNHNQQDYIESSERLSKKLFYSSVFAQSGDKLYPLYDSIQSFSKQVEEIKKVRLTQELDMKYDLRREKDKNRFLDERNRFYYQLSLKNKEQATLLTIILIAVIAFTLYAFYNAERIRKTKKELEKNIQEKDFLFKELNHRVKNNLLIVNSFIGIEKHGQPEEVKAILGAVENRIHSLGLMHELLYKGEMSERSLLKPYLEKLIAFISKSIVNEGIEIHILAEDNIEVHINKTSYIGLIVNELITNAIKYAKAPTRALTISIKMYQEKSDLFLEIADDGIGLPETINIHNLQSLGLKMADGLARQLKGKFTIEKPAVGTKFVIQIPNQ